MRYGKSALVLALAFLMGLAAQPASAQRRRWARPGPHPPKVQAPKRNANPPKADENKSGGVGNEKTNPAKPPGDGRGLAGLPPKWVERLQEMSPQEQERFMRNNAHFQSLPPERQQQIRQNLQRWNRLSPTERNAFRDRERVWEQMTPEQRQYVQNELLPKWQQMPQNRRQLLVGRLHTLQGMTPAEHQAALNDPQFMQGLSPEEQSVLRGLDTLRNPVTP
jgi:hypothetical protein